MNEYIDIESQSEDRKRKIRFICDELTRLRNRHVAILLSDLGSDLPSWQEAKIKQSFSVFKRDVMKNLFKLKDSYYVNEHEPSTQDRDQAREDFENRFNR